MWRRTACLLIWVIALGAPGTCLGQDRTGVPLPAHCPGVRFEISHGRITALHLHAGQSRLCRGGEPESPIRELMLVNGEGTTPMVRYERHDPDQNVTIEITDGCRVSMARESLAAAAGLDLLLEQPANGGLTVSIGKAPDRRRTTAASLWHLLLAERRLCEDEIFPLLQLLRPTWNFCDAAERLESALYRVANSGEVVPRGRLAELVAELGHRDFQRRQEADRQLLGYGPVILPYLAAQSAQRLTAEQTSRIRKLRELLSPRVTDHPERVALWLADDEQVWVTLLRHHDPEKRHLAALRLAEIRPEGIHFDPYGDDHYREKQLAHLKLAPFP